MSATAALLCKCLTSSNPHSQRLTPAKKRPEEGAHFLQDTEDFGQQDEAIDRETTPPHSKI